MVLILNLCKMTKYSRFDPRNKKKGRNKLQSQHKNLRIRHVEKKNVLRPQKIADEEEIIEFKEYQRVSC